MRKNFPPGIKNQQKNLDIAEGIEILGVIMQGFKYPWLVPDNTLHMVPGKYHKTDKIFTQFVVHIYPSIFEIKKILSYHTHTNLKSAVGYIFSMFSIAWLMRTIFSSVYFVLVTTPLNDQIRLSIRPKRTH